MGNYEPGDTKISKAIFILRKTKTGYRSYLNDHHNDNNDDDSIQAILADAAQAECERERETDRKAKEIARR